MVRYEHAVFRMSGESSLDFLQGQLSCDLREVNDFTWRFGAHSNREGRVMALWFVFRENGELCLVTTKPEADFAIQRLRQYARFSKVALSEASDQAVFAAEPKDPIFFQKHPPFSVLKQDNRLMLVTPYESLWCVGDNTKPWPNINLLSEETAHLCALRAGWPRLYETTRGLFTPHALQLPKWQAVSFSKGCYLGQEVVARMHFRAKPKDGLRVAHYEHEKAVYLPGSTLLLNTLSATVVDICSDQHTHHILLHCPHLSPLSENTYEETRQHVLLHMD